MMTIICRAIHFYYFFEYSVLPVASIVVFEIMAVVVLPMPPFWLARAITFVIVFYLLFVQQTKSFKNVDGVHFS